MSTLRTGTRCLRCDKIFFDKSNYNRHHITYHQSEGPQLFESNVAFKEEGGTVTTNFDWKFSTLSAAPLPAETAAAPGTLERQTRYLSKGQKLYDDPIWAPIGDPSIDMRDEAVRLIDEIDDFSLEASTIVRAQVHRSKSGNLKTQPFQPLKDASGAIYAVTLARFFVFARIYFKLPEEGLQNLVQLALTEVCPATGVCCIEGFMLCLTVHAPNHKNADPLQHSGMHMRRVFRGIAMLHLRSTAGPAIEAFCDMYLNAPKATAFGVLTSMYYEIKRCVPGDKRLLIQRTEPDEGFPKGSAILVAPF
jgi:hypothetical protein